MSSYAPNGAVARVTRRGDPRCPAPCRADAGARREPVSRRLAVRRVRACSSREIRSCARGRGRHTPPRCPDVRLCRAAS